MTTNNNSRADSLIIFDFETTGLSPNQGDRTIEIGAVKLEQGEITDSFQALMNPGMRINSFIEGYTGITNQMLASAAPCSDVMIEFSRFIGSSNLIAHNASFDKRFLESEFARCALPLQGDVGCSLLLAKRIFQDAGSYKLSNLIEYANIAGSGDYHRALYDAEMTAKLWLSMLEHIQEAYGIFDIPYALIKKLTKTPKKAVASLLQKTSAEA